MGKKDLTQKILESFPDVFADCVNALLYGGDKHLQADTLQPAPTETTYPDNDNELHNQFQDISKYELHNGRIKAQYTIENQTSPDKKMPLRKAGYNGAIYRGQYQGTELYPVIDMILYWEKGHWNYPRRLKALVHNSLSEEELQYVDDVQLHVFEMAHLPPEVRELFKSDMRIVVDYLAEEENYVPTGQKIVHTEALLRLLRALSNDERYIDILNHLTTTEKEEGTEMCKLLDRYENSGIRKGITQNIVEITRNMYMQNLSAEDISKLINQNIEYTNSIIALFNRYPNEDNLSIANRLLAG